MNDINSKTANDDSATDEIDATPVMEPYHHGNMLTHYNAIGQQLLPDIFIAYMRIICATILIIFYCCREEKREETFLEQETFSFTSV